MNDKKSKKNKKGIKFLLAILGVLIVILLAVWFSINYVAGYLIEYYGSEALNTNVSVSGVDISAFRGKASIKSLEIANPFGFKSPDLMALGNISIKVDQSTIKSNPIVIDNLVINSPKLYYEVNEKGQSNILIFLANIQEKRHVKKAKEAEKAETKDQGTENSSQQADNPDQKVNQQQAKRLIIKHLVINDIQVDAKMMPLDDKTVQLTLPKLEFNNLGEKEGGKTAQAIIHQILSQISNDAVIAFTHKQLNVKVNQAAEQIANSLNKATQKLRCRLDPNACQGN